MHKGSLILLSIIETMAHYDNTSLDEILDHALNYTEEMDAVSSKMNILMLRLLNDGFTEDEVCEIINNLLLEGMENLNEDEKQIVRDDTKKLILKRKENLNYE